MRWYKKIPELTALVSKVARDIVSDFHFEPFNPRDNGRNRIYSANRFALEVGLRKVMFSQIIDSLVTGEAFGWIGKLSDKQIKESIRQCPSLKYDFILDRKEKNRIVDELFRELKQSDALSLTSRNTFIDEDLLKPRKYRYVASSTMEVLFDDTDILGYRQYVGPKYVEFNTKEILRFTQMDIDGKVNGFTPVESILLQLELLRNMWNNMLSIHKNGGSPDNIFILKNVQPDSPAYKRIVEQLKQYKASENKHGNMVFTGEISVETINQLEHMQFTDSGLYITGLIAMQWQIPRSSIPYILNNTNTKDDTGGNSERSYWELVDFMQKTFADTMNTQLWIPYFGVKIVFDKKYVQKDIQKETAKQLLLNNLKLQKELLQTSGYDIKPEIFVKEIGYNMSEVIESEQKTSIDNVQSNLDKQPDATITDTIQQSNTRIRKRDEQLLTEASRGKPTGVAKEFNGWDYDALLEYKSLSSAEVQEVDFDTFVRLYQQDASYQSGMPPRIFRKKQSEFTSFKFKSSDFVYLTIVPTIQLDEMRVRLMNLGSNIYDI